MIILNFWIFGIPESCQNLSLSFMLHSHNYFLSQGLENICLSTVHVQHTLVNYKGLLQKTCREPQVQINTIILHIM